MLTSLGHSPAVTASYRQRQIVIDAWDNLIASGVNYNNWYFSVGSIGTPTGMMLYKNGNENFASINVYKANTGQAYWCRAITGGNGTFQIGPVGFSGCQWGDITGGAVLLKVPEFYTDSTGLVKIYASGSAPHKLVISNASSTAGSVVRVHNINIYPQPVSSTDNLFVRGDLWSLYDAGISSAVERALTGYNAKYILQMGDSADENSAHTHIMDNSGINLYITGKGGRILPTFGNHDTYNAAMTRWRDFYQLTGTGAGYEFRRDGRYYHYKLQNVHVFNYENQDAQAVNADGNATNVSTATGCVMGQFICTGAKASDRAWKVAIVHQPGYCSDDTHYSSHMRWPWANCGFDAVFCGHHHVYERGSLSGFMWFIVGKGGNSRVSTWGPTHYEPSSMVRKEGVTFVGKLNDSTNVLVIEMWNTGQQLLDRIKLLR